MRPFYLLAIGLTAAACATPEQPPQRIEAANPTVSYRYDAGQAEQAVADANRFCDRRYNGRSARLIDDTRRGDDRIAVFECV